VLFCVKSKIRGNQGLKFNPTSPRAAFSSAIVFMCGGGSILYGCLECGVIKYGEGFGCL
jgi:hypothetical protein